MKRIAAGLIILAVIAVCAAAVSITADRYVEAAAAKVDSSMACWRAGDSGTAIILVQEASDEWQSHQTFNDIFIRHSETDDARDAFGQLLGALRGDDEGSITAAYSIILGHLECIRRMEKPVLGSIM